MPMLRNSLAVLAFALWLPLAQAAEPAAATVNGKPIRQSLMDHIARDLEDRGQKIDDNARSLILNKLISNELLVQEAQKQGLDKQEDFKLKEELLRRELLLNAYLENYVKTHPVSEADSKAEYEKFKQQMDGKEYNARHILLKTEQEAKDVIAQLGKGADFEKLAREKSQDPGSREDGGSLGWFSPGSMVKPFADAVTKLAKGGYSKAPVQTQFGWHVIKLEDSRNVQPPAYDKVKNALEKEVQQRNLEKLLADLRKKAKIEIPAAK